MCEQGNAKVSENMQKGITGVRSYDSWILVPRLTCTLVGRGGL